MIIPANQIEEFGKVKTRFLKLSNGLLNVEKLNIFLPHSVVVINKSDIKYINWFIQNGVVGWWSKQYFLYQAQPPAHAYTYYFNNLEHAVLFKLRYANDCEEMRI